MVYFSFMKILMCVGMLSFIWQLHHTDFLILSCFCGRESWIGLEDIHHILPCTGHDPYYMVSMNSQVLNHFSRVWLCATLWTIAHQAPPSVGFSRQEYCSGLPRPAPGDLPDPGIEPSELLLHWQVGFLPLVPPGKWSQWTARVTGK